MPKGKPGSASYLAKIINKLATAKVVEADGQIIVVLDQENAYYLARGIGTLISFAEAIAKLRK